MSGTSIIAQIFVPLRTSLADSVDPDQTAPVLGPRCLLLYLIRQ